MQVTLQDIVGKEELVFSVEWRLKYKGSYQSKLYYLSQTIRKGHVCDRRALSLCVWLEGYLW